MIDSPMGFTQRIMEELRQKNKKAHQTKKKLKLPVLPQESRVKAEVLIPEKKAMIYTDGCYKSNGDGGWCAIIQLNDGVIVLGAYAPKTTNNRMEMMPTIEAMSLVKNLDIKSCEVISDSMYLVDGLNQWVTSWRARGWTKKTPGQIMNLDLWKNLYDLKQVVQCKARWVRGHRGHKENELCDLLANYCCAHHKHIALRIPDLSDKSIGKMITDLSADT